MNLTVSGADVEAIPIDDRVLTRLIDDEISGARARDRGRSADHRAAQRRGAAAKRSAKQDRGAGHQQSMGALGKSTPELLIAR